VLVNQHTGIPTVIFSENTSSEIFFVNFTTIIVREKIVEQKPAINLNVIPDMHNTGFNKTTKNLRYKTFYLKLGNVSKCKEK
jgi:hypothetical protein